jgi:hypothetical protein
MHPNDIAQGIASVDAYIECSRSKTAIDLDNDADTPPNDLRRATMDDEIPYLPAPLSRPIGHATTQDALPMPELKFSRPVGAWVIGGFLMLVSVGMWALVAGLFIHRS